MVSGGKAYRGTPLNQSLGRINPDGSLDATFKAPAMDFGGAMAGVSVHSDGKIVCAASYLNKSFRFVTQLVRLNDNGSLDTSFTSGVLAAGTVARTVVQPDGKVVVCGVGFTQYAGVPVSNLFRLNSDGSFDDAFDATAVGKDLVNGMIGDDQGRLVLYRGSGGSPLGLRLLANGKRDTSFEIPTGYGTYGFALQSDGRILVSGSRIEGASVVFGVYRLNGGGSTVIAPPTIVSQPLGLGVVEGADASLSVQVTGEGTLNYQWQKNGSNIPGANLPSLAIKKVSGLDAGNYAVIVSNEGGSIKSTTAVLTVTSVPAEPVLGSIQFALLPGKEISLAWPAGYSLQASDQLLPQGAWTQFPGVSPLKVSTSGSSKFFRLIKNP